MSKITKVKCPTCSESVTWSADAKWKPFCSERCKLIDLGEWFSEGYKVPSQEMAPATNDEEKD
ncbi:MAG: DNA gyrase inhibitor YacG [Methylococcales bacterium]|jgi:uncharacterized protein|nr:DNA gyrase inhibitor YacG [Methylococcales bacterium]MBT7446079.1 DNA gyrase inhibitor YacG [Methylococcales bacterium]